MPLHLHGVADAAEQPRELRGGAAAAARGGGREGGDVAGAEAEERVGLVEDRRHHLAGLPGRRRRPGLQVEHLDDALGVEVPPALLDALVGEAAEVGGAVALQDADAEVASSSARSDSGSISAMTKATSKRERRAELARLLEQGEEEARRPDVPGRAQVAQATFDLQLGLADARRG